MFALHLIISLSVSLAAPPSILPPKELATARTLVSEISEFIMTLDLGSGTVKGYNKTWPGTLNASIFINGNGGGGYGIGPGGELRINGFAGLALLELIHFGITYIDESRLFE